MAQGLLWRPRDMGAAVSLPALMAVGEAEAERDHISARP